MSIGFEQRLIVRVLVLLSTTSGEAKVGQFYVPASIQ